MGGVGFYVNEYLKGIQDLFTRCIFVKIIYFLKMYTILMININV